MKKVESTWYEMPKKQKSMSKKKDKNRQNKLKKKWKDRTNSTKATRDRLTGCSTYAVCSVDGRRVSNSTRTTPRLRRRPSTRRSPLRSHSRPSMPTQAP